MGRTGEVHLGTATGWAVAGRLLGLLGFAVDTVVVARVLGTERFGTYAVLVSGALIGGLLATSGVNRVLLRELAGARSQARQADAGYALAFSVRRLARWLPLAGGVVGLVSASLAQTNGIGGKAVLAAGMAILVASWALQRVASEALRGAGEVRWASVFEGRAGGGLSLLLHALLFGSAASSSGADTVVWSIALFAVAMAVTTAAAFVLLGRALGEALGIDLWEVVRQAHRNVRREADLTRSSRHFTLNQILAFLSGNVELWAAGIWLSALATSHLAIGLRVMYVVAFPLTVLRLSAVTTLRQTWAEGDTRAFERFLRTAATAVALPALGAVGLLVLGPQEILKTAFGQEFANAAAIVVVLAVGQAVNAFTGLCGEALAMTGHEALITRMTLGVGVIEVALAVVAAISGSALALAGVYSVTTALLFSGYTFELRRVLGVWSHATIRPAFRTLFSLGT